MANIAHDSFSYLYFYIHSLKFTDRYLGNNVRATGFYLLLEKTGEKIAQR